MTPPNSNNNNSDDSSKTAGIVGLGLIGGSFARVCKLSGMRVIGADSSPEARRLAKESGVVDEVSDDIAKVCEADEILLAVPVCAFARVFSALHDSLRPSSVVFDGGSCKRVPLKQSAKMLRGKAGRFVPSHPIAGGEDSGFSASSATLFEGRRVVLCPADADDDAVETVRAAWRRAGAVPDEMTAEEHDNIFAAVSHLPHVLSFALVESIHRHDSCERMLQYAASGFRDFTRIAGSDPRMWRDICIQNGDNILEAMTRFRRELDMLEEAVRNADGEALEGIFTEARALRRAWIRDIEGEG